MDFYPPFSVVGKRILLTGAGGGIGNALLKGFLAGGSHVAGVDLAPHPEGESLRLLFGEKYAHFSVDLSCGDEVKGLGAQAEKMLNGPLDVVIHAAWACPDAAPYTLERLRATAAVGLEAAYILYGEIAPEMAERDGGSIISIGSMNGIYAFPENPSYTAMKAALRLFTKTIARDYGERGVRANNLCPGYVRTNMTALSYADPAMNEMRRSRTMLGRWAEPEDMVGPCIFLASDASRYVTGIDLLVDGGWTAKGL